MKKIKLFLCVIAVASMALVSCSKDKTYSFKMKYDLGVPVNVFIKEYDASGSCCKTNTIDNVEINKEYRFTAGEHAEKVVAGGSVTLNNGITYTRYVSNVFYLDESNTEIVVDGNTILTTKNPISGKK